MKLCLDRGGKLDSNKSIMFLGVDDKITASSYKRVVDRLGERSAATTIVAAPGPTSNFGYN